MESLRYLLQYKTIRLVRRSILGMVQNQVTESLQGSPDSLQGSLDQYFHKKLEMWKLIRFVSFPSYTPCNESSIATLPQEPAI
jgi:hypothetical protein